MNTYEKYLYVLTCKFICAYVCVCMCKYNIYTHIYIYIYIWGGGGLGGGGSTVREARGDEACRGRIGAHIGMARVVSMRGVLGREFVATV